MIILIFSRCGIWEVLPDGVMKVKDDGRIPMIDLRICAGSSQELWSGTGLGRIYT